MATFNTHTGDGSTVLFSFTFPYIEESDVKASLDDVDTTAYSFNNATTLQFDAPPALNAAIRIYRDTDSSDLKSAFFAGSSIRAKDLNDNFTQSLYVTQEVQDAFTVTTSTADDALTKATAAEVSAGQADVKADAAVDTADDAEDVAEDAADDVKRWIKDGDGSDTAGNEDDADFTQRPLKPQGVPYAVAQAASAVSTANTARDNAVKQSGVTPPGGANSAITIAEAADAIADASKLATDRLVGTTSNAGSTWTVTGNNTNASTDPKGVGWAITQGEAGKLAGDAAKLASDRLVATTSDGGSTWTVAGNNTNASTDPKGVGYAVTTAEAARDNAVKQSGVTPPGGANAAITIAEDAYDNAVKQSGVTPSGGANAAITIAEAADAIADTAKLATDRLVATTSNGGTTWTLTGNNTNASTDPKGVGYAVTTAETALTSANASAAAVADAVLYTTVANKAALEAVNPSEDGYYEVTDSTGLANGTWTDDVDNSITYTLSGIPGTYPNTQLSGISTKFQYTHSSKTHTYKAYSAVDGDDRYMVGPASDGSNGQYLQTNGSGVKSWATVDLTPLAPKASPTFTGTVTGPTINASTALQLGGVAVTSTAAELNYSDGVTSNIQTQINTKAPLASPALTGTATAVNLTLSGDLTVNGTTSTINSTTLQVDDKNIELGTVSTPSDATADGGGITLKGASDKTIIWTNSTDTWDFNQGIKVTGTGTFTGDVGVGTTAPDAPLHVVNSSGEALHVAATGANQWIYSRFTGGSPSLADLRIGVKSASDGASGFINQVNNSSLEFSTNDTERMEISGAGSVLIGPSGAPATTITAAGAATFAGLMKCGSAQVEVSSTATNNLYGGNSYFGGTGDSSGNANASILNTGTVEIGTSGSSGWIKLYGPGEGGSAGRIRNAGCVLNEDGSSTFAGNLSVDRTVSGDGCFHAKLNGVTKASITSAGAATFDGTITAAGYSLSSLSTLP